MATYNWSSVLPYSIGSVLLQEFKDFELLVVGDGCTDDSAAVVAGINDPRVRWIGLVTNSGHQSTPNNAGLAQARGELIAYLGHDDLWLPHHLTCLVAAIKDGADLAWTAARWISPLPFDPVLMVSGDYQPGKHIAPSVVLHRKAVTDSVGGWQDCREIDGFPETELWARIHAAGYRIAPVQRMTALKLPAGRRRNVYRERPHLEQAAWLKRIRSEPNLEIAELLGLVATRRPPERMRYIDLWQAVWRETRRRIKVRLTRRVSGPGAAIEALRRYKGLGTVPRTTGARSSTSDQGLPQ